METERAEALAKEQTLRESLSQLTREREHLEAEMTEKLDTLRRESSRSLEECKNKIA